MSKYSIGQPDLNGLVWIEDIENGKVFNGYDFMGSVIWEDYGEDACWMTPEEAEQIVSDLEAADEPAEHQQKILVVLHNTDTHCIFHELMWTYQFQDHMEGWKGLSHMKVLSAIPVDDPEAFIHEDINDLTSARYQH